MTYHMTYNATSHVDGIERGDIPDGHGATDAMVIASILYGADGSSSVALASHDGRTDAPLPIVEVFKAWANIAHALKDEETLDPAWRDLCRRVFEEVRAVVMERRGLPCDS